jgi:hypothetical protein
MTKKHVRMFVDDIRNPGLDLGEEFYTWIVVRTVAAAIDMLKTCDVVECSLDHDLGGRQTGYDIVCWMEENDVWPRDGVYCHSANPVGYARIMSVINRHKVNIEDKHV